MNDLADLLDELCSHTKEHADELACGGFTEEAEAAYASVTRARAAAERLRSIEEMDGDDAPADYDPMDVRYCFQIFVDGEWQAGGDAPAQADAEREARHYQAQYSQEGNCIIQIERCETVALFGDGGQE